MIEKYRNVDAALRAEVDALIGECACADGFTLELYTDAGLNVCKNMECAFAAREGGRLCGFLFVFAPTGDEVEINALVHPACRRRGLLGAMLAEAMEACGKFGYCRGYLLCNEASADALGVMEHWKRPLSHIEYQMEYRVAPHAEPANPEVRLVGLTLADVPVIAPLMAECFGKDAEQEATYLTNSLGTPDRMNWVLRDGAGAAVGFCGAYREGTAFSIFGLGVMPGMRRRGYARLMLGRLAAMAESQGMETLKLDVDSGNPNAFRLYESYGFAKVSATRYYEFRFRHDGTLRIEEQN